MIGKVIKIPNEYNIIVSKSIIDNIDIGDIVEIYEIASEVIDPETKEVLGTYDFTKQELKVSEIYDRYFVCNKIEERVITPFDLDFKTIMKHTEYTKKALEVNSEQNENLSLKTKEIKIGDPVKIVRS